MPQQGRIDAVQLPLARRVLALSRETTQDGQVAHPGDALELHAVGPPAWRRPRLIVQPLVVRVPAGPEPDVAAGGDEDGKLHLGVEDGAGLGVDELAGLQDGEPAPHPGGGAREGFGGALGSAGEDVRVDEAADFRREAEEGAFPVGVGEVGFEFLGEVEGEIAGNSYRAGILESEEGLEDGLGAAGGVAVVSVFDLERSDFGD